KPGDLGKILQVVGNEPLLDRWHLEKEESCDDQEKYGRNGVGKYLYDPFFNNLQVHLSSMQPVLLAIESSCDETSASVISNGKVLNNIIASQAVHQIYGGVVPELASRAHQQNIVMVVRDAMDKASISTVDLDAIAVTRGPGLMGSLLVGLSFAKGMALALKVPLIEVNHM